MSSNEDLSKFEHILYNKEDSVAKITINRPKVKNALNEQSNQEIYAALRDAEGDDDIRVVTITGTGDSFCAGMDVKSLPETSVSPGRAAISVVKGKDIAREARKYMDQMTKPIIAVINGYALGGGLELSLHCDIRIALKNAQMGLTETALGLIPGNGGTQRLPRLIGLGRAKEMIFLAKRITGEEAERIGLVNCSVDPDQLSEVVQEYENKIKERAPLAIAYAKAAINKTWQCGLEEGTTYERYYSMLVAQTEDRIEGINAFREKRKPNWKSK